MSQFTTETAREAGKSRSEAKQRAARLNASRPRSRRGQPPPEHDQLVDAYADRYGDEFLNPPTPTRRGRPAVPEWQKQMRAYDEQRREHERRFFGG